MSKEPATVRASRIQGKYALIAASIATVGVITAALITDGFGLLKPSTAAAGKQNILNANVNAGNVIVGDGNTINQGVPVNEARKMGEFAKRALHRFSSIRVYCDIHVPLDHDELTEFRTGLNAGFDRNLANEKLPDGNRVHITLGFTDPRFPGEILTQNNDSSLVPKPGSLADHLLRNIFLEVSIFEEAIPNNQFLPLGVHVKGVDAQTPDVWFVAEDPGKDGQMIFDYRVKDWHGIADFGKFDWAQRERVLCIRVRGYGSENWQSSGDVVSIPDLDGAQVFLSIRPVFSADPNVQYSGLRDIYASMEIRNVRLKFDNRRIEVPNERLRTGTICILGMKQRFTTFMLIAD